ncbi:MAG TPA: hypothetical protein VFZ61_21735 [Polyangiales bacterium]
MTIRLSTSSPQDGEGDFPLDAPLIFDVHCELDESWSAGIVRDAACSDFGDRLELTLRADGDAEPVAGVSGALHGRLVFLPSQPLRAHTLYRAEARVRAQPSNILSEPASELSFRTGAAPLPALASAEAPSVTLEWFDAPVLTCDGGELVGEAAREYLLPKICPTGPYSNCKEAGSRRALRYRVAVGPMTGGEARLPYILQVIQTDATPGSLSTPWRIGSPSDAPDRAEHHLSLFREVNVASGERGELFLDAPVGADDPDRLCVRMRVIDAAGHALAPEARCDDRTARQATPKGDSTGESAAEGDTAGCSVRAGTSAPYASLFVGLLFGIGIGGRVRARARMRGAQ